MAGAIYKIISNLVRVRAQILANAIKAVEDAGGAAVQGIWDTMLDGYHTPHGDPPHTEIFETGALFASIDTGDTYFSGKHQVSIDVGTEGIPYAGFVHNGTSMLESRPFIVDGVTSHLDEIEQKIGAALIVGFDT